MNEPNFYDTVVDELHKTKELVHAELTKQYRRQKPFRMEPVDNDSQLWIYDNMTVEDMSYAVKTYGEDTVNQFIYDMEKMKARRVK